MMSEVWLTHTLRRLLTAGARDNFHLILSEPPAAKPSDKLFLISVDGFEPRHVYVRMPRWLSKLWIKRLLRKRGSAQ